MQSSVQREWMFVYIRLKANSSKRCKKRYHSYIYIKKKNEIGLDMSTIPSPMETLLTSNYTSLKIEQVWSDW